MVWAHAQENAPVQPSPLRQQRTVSSPEESKKSPRKTVSPTKKSGADVAKPAPKKAVAAQKLLLRPPSGSPPVSSRDRKKTRSATAAKGEQQEQDEIARLKAELAVAQELLDTQASERSESPLPTKKRRRAGSGAERFFLTTAEESGASRESSTGDEGSLAAFIEKRLYPIRKRIV
jgi:hypothetical protein